MQALWGPDGSVVRGSAVQCSAVQCSAVQCSAVQCSAPQVPGQHRPARWRGFTPGLGLHYCRTIVGASGIPVLDIPQLGNLSRLRVFGFGPD
jgi:hypothetical protein